MWWCLCYESIHYKMPNKKKADYYAKLLTILGKNAYVYGIDLGDRPLHGWLDMADLKMDICREYNSFSDFHKDIRAHAHC